jgi:BirA family transcriptional regulator, biotin operon repressor / biotin---[acetyl-CoA-carboxylase] ligase
VRDAFDLKRIAAEAFVAEVAYRPEVSSTNDWALEMAREGGHRLPLLALASQQTRGRGRGANRWWSSPGALTFSLLLDTREVLPAPSALPRLSLIAGLSVCEALTPLTAGSGVRLKWPNDVLLDRRKVCGILVESPAHPPERCVVGIGINVNNSFSDAPEELRQRAVSLADAMGVRGDLTEVLVSVLKRLAAELDDFQAGRLTLSSACLPWCALTGRTVAIAAGKRRVEGVCVGIDEEGALRVRTHQSEQRLFSGVVESIRWDESSHDASRTQT